MLLKLLGHIASYDAKHMKVILTIVALVLRCTDSWAQVVDKTNDLELAGLLSNTSTRASAVARLAAAGKSKVSLLISWTHDPPPHVDKAELYVGLADAFGQLKAAEAIPFLMRHISLNRYPSLSANTWLKTPEVVQERLACVRALIQIGPEASRALISAVNDGRMAEHRLEALFVISRIKGVSEARDFLLSELGRINQERYLVEEGLKLQGPH